MKSCPHIKAAIKALNQQRVTILSMGYDEATRILCHKCDTDTWLVCGERTMKSDTGPDDDDPDI
jgi:hypothetical protein